MWLTTEQLNFVGAFNVGDANGITTCFPCQIVNMAKYDSMVAVVQCGWGSSYRIYAQYASTASITPGSTGNMCIGRARASGYPGPSSPSTADLLTAYSALTTTGSSSVFVMTTTTNAITTSPFTTTDSVLGGRNVYIEIKADDLPQGYTYVAIAVSTAAQAHPLAVNYIMKPRYLQNAMMPACT
jgi:hypothetical protein